MCGAERSGEQVWQTTMKQEHRAEREVAEEERCIDHYTRTVSEWTKDNTVSFGLRDMTKRFRDCLRR